MDQAKAVLELGQELETAICMHTHFTGDPPYVGTEGLVLAIKEQAAALKQIARGDYDSYAGDPSKWASIIAYKAIGGRHKDGVALDPELLGEPSSHFEQSNGGQKDA